MPIDLPGLDPDDINIVVMGEIGVGKSTFIKAFVNYLRRSLIREGHIYRRFTRCCIAGKCITDDEYFVEENFVFGDADNECTTPGASSTQSIISYRVFMGDRYIRLIDTPGLGKTHATDKDKKNYSRLLEVLSELRFIHAFCIVLKSSNAELSVFFQNCIKQLLFRLGKDASKNMVFIFTNSRSTFYKPGDGQVAIKKLLQSFKDFLNVNVPFDNKNIFCVDNEGFIMCGDSIWPIDPKNVITSWNKSKDVFFR